MQKVSTSWLIYQVTGSETWLSLDAFASGFTTVALLPWGGIVADRLDWRTLLIWTNAISAALVLASLRAVRFLRLAHRGGVGREWHCAGGDGPGQRLAPTRRGR